LNRGARKGEVRDCVKKGTPHDPEKPPVTAEATRPGLGKVNEN